MCELWDRLAYPEKIRLKMFTCQKIRLSVQIGGEI